MFQSKAAKAEKLESAVIEALGTPNWLQSVRVDEDGRAVLVIEADPNALDVAE